MKRMLTAAAAAVLALSATAGVAGAQPYGHHDNGYHNGRQMGRHDWRKGGRIEHGDWDRGQRIDWRRHHLRRPPRGYEWRQVDDQYVLAAAATGLIVSIIAASH